jgi:predicted lipoprotein with Yx(FWY)xxD motif
MTLYTFDKDMAGSGKSVCNGPCATLWPPLIAAAAATPMDGYTLLTRDDGTKQWAYKGKPLYYFQNDKTAADHLGDNFKDVWHVVK